MQATCSCESVAGSVSSTSLLPGQARPDLRHVSQDVQLVLLDHGLYRELKDDFRLEYAGLWRSLVFADIEGIHRHSVKMNAGHAVPIFAAMLTQRPWDDVSSRRSSATNRLELRFVRPFQVIDKSLNHLDLPKTKEHREQLARFAAEHVREISDMLQKMPREMVLLLKTNDCLRSVDSLLGEKINTFVITARECTKALAADRIMTASASTTCPSGPAAVVVHRVLKEARLLPLRLANSIEALMLEMRICTLNLIMWCRRRD